LTQRVFLELLFSEQLPALLLREPCIHACRPGVAIMYIRSCPRRMRLRALSCHQTPSTASSRGMVARQRPAASYCACSHSSTTPVG
jgi:hypothetical protein